MEDTMPARTTRTEARARLVKTMMAALDRMIPEDESQPLRGSKFIDWERQATAFKQAVIPTLLEERAALEPNAQVSRGGPCPYCGSDSVYLENPTTQAEARGPDGPVVITKQHGRCRCCDGSFSPAEP
jgi:hypothetical protein